MDRTRNSPPHAAFGQLLPNAQVDEFFLKMKNDFRRPKPSEEAVAEALRAMLKLTGESAEAENSGATMAHDAVEADNGVATETELGKSALATNCLICGGVNLADNRFCGFCGASLRTSVDRTTTKPRTGDSDSGSAAQEQHVHHHHYHHHYFPPGARVEAQIANVMAESAASAQDAGAQNASEDEVAIRKLVENWMLACNAKRLDDLADFYAAEALLLRPNAAVVRGRDAIRQALETAIQFGLGDVVLDRIEITMFGEAACVTGRSRMLMPLAPGNRHERKGKVLLLTTRNEGSWKIAADMWCLDEVTQREVRSKK